MAERFRPTRLALALGATLLIAGGAAAWSAGGCGQGTPSTGATSARPSQELASSQYGAVAHATAKALASSAPSRGADTWGEIRAREFVFGTFQQYGYMPYLQEFIATKGGRRVHSANIVAVKEGESAERLVIGAHYDARGGEGYTDNASGVSLLLELAARVRARRTPYTLVFVAFGADAAGQRGSRYFVDKMPEMERRAARGMINLDAVAGGDRLYVFSLPGAATWLRDDILAAAERAKVELAAPPARIGLGAGTARFPSGDAAFVRAGIPAATLVATSWGAGVGDGRVQTVDSGRIWDTRQDTVRFVEGTYPGRMLKQLGDLTRVLERVLTRKLEKNP